VLRYFDATLQRVAEAQHATAYDRDCVAHLGERLSIKLIDAHCKELGLPSALCESDEVREEPTHLLSTPPTQQMHEPTCPSHLLCVIYL